YTALIADTMLAVLKEWWPHRAPEAAMPFVDVFCETGAFSLEQSRRILSAALQRPTDNARRFYFMSALCRE
ncbi:MAG: hypothetical protein WCP31_05630, partial [Chloroflexales bacterium]